MILRRIDWHSFIQYVLSPYYKPGTEMNKVFVFERLQFWQRIKKLKYIQYIYFNPYMLYYEKLQGYSFSKTEGEFPGSLLHVEIS